MTATKPEIKIGQVWQTRGGKEAKVVAYDYETDTGYVWDLDFHPTKSGDPDNGADFSVDDYGFYLVETSEDPRDLVELIEDSPLPVEMVDEDMPDMNELAAETLSSLGWHFDGQCWVQSRTAIADADVASHPLYPIFVAAIEQAMYGKGERHGGAKTPFCKQPWAHYSNMHGRGFLTGQAAKKLEEAASTREGTAFETEVFGAMVYLGMSVLKERKVV